MEKFHNVDNNICNYNIDQNYHVREIFTINNVIGADRDRRKVYPRCTRVGRKYINYSFRSTISRLVTANQRIHRY